MSVCVAVDVRFLINSVGVGALRRPVLKRTQLLPRLVQREVAFLWENDGGIVIVSLRLGFCMFISCYTARNEPKNRARGVPLDPLPPPR